MEGSARPIKINKGCGLGLTVWKKILMKMKGDINILSRKHKGTIFWCMFRSSNLESENLNYEESEEQVEELHASRVYSSIFKLLSN